LTNTVLTRSVDQSAAAGESCRSSKRSCCGSAASFSPRTSPLIITGLAANKPLKGLISPMLGTVLAIGFVVQALWWSPRPEDYEDGQG